MTKLVLVTFGNRLEEGRGIANAENNPICNRKNRMD